MTDAAALGPLAGLKVVEICSTIAGPACTRLLADFGADVVKIEPHEGDPGRQIGDAIKNVSLYAASLLRGKQSLALDLKSKEGRELAFALCAKADIVVENNRPGVIERLGLGYEALAVPNPGLIMVRISGYGQDGPYAQRPGYGVICEALAGVRHMTGDPDRPPARVALGSTDYLGSIYAAFGAMAAIHERSNSGRGQVVDVALYEAAFAQMELYVPTYEKLGKIPIRVGPNVPAMAPNSLYPTSDANWVLIAANSTSVFARLTHVMERDDLLTDPRFESIRSRGVPENTRALDTIVGDWTRRFETSALEDILSAADVPNSRVYTIADIFKDPHYAARDMLLEVAHPVLGTMIQAGVIPKLSRTPGAVRSAGPEIGADTHAVLREAGLTAEQIDILIAKNVVKAP